METPQVNRKQIDDLRAWFFAKDRSISLAQNCLYYLFAGGQANGAYMSMAFIAETILSASVASVTFSSIPQDFSSLLLYASIRTDAAAESDGLVFRFNSDSGANYDTEVIAASGGTLISATARGATSVSALTTEAANSRGNNFGPGLIWIFDYSRVVEKQFLALSCNFGDLSADIDLRLHIRSGHWRNTNVCTSITILPLAGPNFVSRSRFQLYGIL